MKGKIIGVISIFVFLLAACDKSFLFPEFHETQNGVGSKNPPPDPCLTAVCPTNSTCENGKCQCYLGFEGPLCSTGYADKFVGIYQGSDTIDGDIWITIAPLKVTKIDNQNIKIENFGGFQSYIYAKIEKDTFNAPTADKIVIDFTDPAARYFNGNGLLKNGDIHGIYTVTYNDGYMETYTFTMERL